MDRTGQRKPRGRLAGRSGSALAAVALALAAALAAAGCEDTKVSVQAARLPPPSGTLDPSFGGSGYVVESGTAGATGAPGSALDDRGTAMAVDASGRIVVAGHSDNAAGQSTLAIWRILSNGTLDTAFGCAAGTGCPGYATQANSAGGNSDDGAALLVDPSGRIVVAGSSMNAGGGSEMAIWRYLSNGTLDTAFGCAPGTGCPGFVVQAGTAGGSNDYGRAVTLDASGNIVVAGQSQTPSGYATAVWRYLDNGTLDTTFNTTGFSTSSGAAGGSNDNGTAVTLDPSGGILSAGASQNSGGYFQTTLWRYTAAGALDPTFNTTGFAVAPARVGAAPIDESARAIRVVHGQLVAVGYSHGASTYDLTFWAYNTDGTAAGSFTESTGNAANAVDDGFALDVDVFSRIVVAGTSTDAAGNYRMAVWRFLPDGSLDPTFHSSGTAYFSVGNGWGSGHGVALDAAGRIVVAGDSWTAGSYHEMVTWRVFQ